MAINEKYPVLFGYTEDNKKTELHGINEVARFICEKGAYGDVRIVTELDQPFISTMGTFLDQAFDKEYRAELLKIMIPMQEKIRNGSNRDIPDESPEDRMERAINEYLESEEYEVDLAVEVRWYQEEGLSMPSNEFIESVLVKRKREQIEKEIEYESSGHKREKTNVDPENGINDLKCENRGTTEHIQWV